MSSVKANSYYDTSGGSNAQLYGVASPPNSMGFRNRILNGGMVIDQRNAGASVTPTTTTYTLDRWRLIASQSSKFSVQQNAGSVTPPVGIKNYLGITSLSAYSVTTGDVFSIQQKIEGYNVSDLGFGTATASTFTLSFWVRSSLTGTFGGVFGNEAADRCYIFSYTINAANTWERKTITITGDTSGTWLTNNGVGLDVRLNFGSGSDKLSTAGSWGSTFYNSVTGQISVIGTSGATFYITGVQLEAGTVASAFERRDYGRELMMCQRYYQVSENFIGGAGNTTSFTGNINFIVTMRASPTVGQSAVLAITDIANADFTQSSANISITAGTRVTTNAVSITANNFSGLTTNRPLISIPSTTGKVTLSAEL